MRTIVNPVFTTRSIETFVFGENSFTHKGRMYQYNDIESLKFSIANVSVNFSTNEIVALSLRMSGGTLLTLSIQDAAFTFGKKKVAEKKKNLAEVYDYINRLTFNRRLASYLRQLEEKGYVLYKFGDDTSLFGGRKVAKIGKDGTVYLDGKTVHLDVAKAGGTLKFGTAYGFGLDRTMDPYEISINEKAPMFGGRIEGLDSIRIDGAWDFPIIFEIIKSVS